MKRLPHKVGLDTSCLIALLSDWHEFHQPTARTYERIIRQKNRLVIAGHALLECFAVLTRLPPPFRIPPDKARRMLVENFASSAEVPGMPSSAFWSIVDETALRGFGGGRVYDATVALATRRAGAGLLLTWNVRDFLAVAPPGLAVREPSAKAY